MEDLVTQLVDLLQGAMDGQLAAFSGIAFVLVNLYKDVLVKEFPEKLKWPKQKDLALLIVTGVALVTTLGGSLLLSGFAWPGVMLDALKVTAAAILAHESMNAVSDSFFGRILVKVLRWNVVQKALGIKKK